MNLLFRHVNSGVYLSLLDLARTDLMIRSGLFGPVRRRGWYPVVTAESNRFRRSLAGVDPDGAPTMPPWAAALADAQEALPGETEGTG